MVSLLVVNDTDFDEHSGSITSQSSAEVGKSSLGVNTTTSWLSILVWVGIVIIHSFCSWKQLVEVNITSLLTMLHASSSKLKSSVSSTWKNIRYSQKYVNMHLHVFL